MVRRLRLVFSIALLTVVAALAAALIVWTLAVDSEPDVDRVAEFTPDQIERAKRILESHNPRRLRAGEIRTMAIAAGDVDVAVNYLANRYVGGSVRTTFEEGEVRLYGSVRAPLPGTRYLNVRARLVEGDPLPVLASLRVGRVPVPSQLVPLVVRRVMASRVSDAEFAIVSSALQRVVLQSTGARVTYAWDSTLVETVRGALIRPAERERLRAYQEWLVATTRALPPGAVSLQALLPPLFAVAARRAAQGDAVAENRAAILVLTLYVDGRSLYEIVPEARQWGRPVRRTVTLAGRGDLAKHFMTSAALSSNTGGPFADAVGIYKEVADSRGGSGFSFDDIAADRSGSRLGSMAEDAGRADRLQQLLGDATGELFIMPPIDGLPAGLPEREFRHRYGEVGTPAYDEVIADIDRRIDRLPLFR